MNTAKIAISIEKKTLTQLDRLVADRTFPNRSKAIQAAIEEKLARLDRGRLERECAKLDPQFERAMAEEGMSGDLAQWPQY